MNPSVGTHLPHTKGMTITEIIMSLDNRVEGYRIPFFQIYLGDRTGGGLVPFEKEDVQEALEIIGKRGFFIHSGLSNYLSNQRNYRHYVKKRILTELRQVKLFPLSGVVIHPGTMNMGGVKFELNETLDLIVSTISDIYKDGNDDLGLLFLENAAGEGYKVFKNIDEMKYVIKKLEHIRDKNGNHISRNIRICIDTCHLFAAGAYDLSKTKEIRKFKKDFDREIGLNYLKLIHLNDSKYEFGCRKDFHENVGMGKIWKSPRILKVLFQEFPDVPYICETRNFSDSMNFIERAKRLLH